MGHWAELGNSWFFFLVSQMIGDLSFLFLFLFCFSLHFLGDQTGASGDGYVVKCVSNSGSSMLWFWNFVWF